MLERLVFLLLLAAYAYGCGTPTFEPNTIRIVNGEDARAHSWPWQISMQVKHGSRWHHTCGGTLIGSRWVLTAGHCVWPGDVYRVVMGEHDQSVQEGTEQIRDVLRILVHPDWDINMVAAGNDLALLKLDKAPIMNENVGLACLPEAGEIPAHGDACFISGWGNLYTHGPMPDKLQQALLPVVGNSVCRQSDWWGMVVKDTMICAGGGEVSGCNGDSGGPLNCKGADGKWYVQGVTSFVSSRVCNEVKKPTVFTRISAFTDWLSNTMLYY
ncbi:Proproteinase E precursor [Salmo salar]|uniref:Proproteinase E n=1 Tax=Salmo salar TaxID=8030 RepID=B5XE19_SALSA|nr:Proproteinase E precursor [Salmo salar]ACI69089.1 Proproteinase E precursor [Salmo salar]|eukprot:NP_001134836.1 Proproteinase E precursor [Salmo salar]